MWPEQSWVWGGGASAFPSACAGTGPNAHPPQQLMSVDPYIWRLVWVLEGVCERKGEAEARRLQEDAWDAAGCSGSRRLCCGRRGGASQGAPRKPKASTQIYLRRLHSSNYYFFLIFLPLFSQPPGAVPGTQPLLPNSMDPTRQQGRPSRGGLNVNVSR